MRAYALAPGLAFGVAILALASSCRKVPVANVYCDGTSRWRCADPAYPRCDPQQKLCLPALGDGGGDLSAADLAGCVSSAGCPDDRPVCDGRVCRACSGSGDDAACSSRSASTPRCFVAAGRCAACAVASVESSDCAAATPICDSGGACRRCSEHAECDSRLCNLDGSCAASATTAYVDNVAGSCTGAHAATLADPACEVGAALAVQPIVRVFGSPAPYARFTLASGNIRVVGADRAPSTVVAGDVAGPAVAVSGAATTVILDQLEITAGAAQDGVYCANPSLGPTLIIRRSYVHGSGALGIDVSKCALTLDRDRIGPANAGGGVSIGGAPYTITNSFIVGNGSGGSGVLFGSGASAAAPGFAHDTVVGNLAGGIFCSGATTIASSIVEGNGAMDTSGSCALIGSTSLVPDFVGGGDYHLAGRSTANLACCIDRISTSPVDHDFDGRPRPQPSPGAWDVGAHEVP